MWLLENSWLCIRQFTFHWAQPIYRLSSDLEPVCLWLHQKICWFYPKASLFGGQRLTAADSASWPLYQPITGADVAQPQQKRNVSNHSANFHFSKPICPVLSHLSIWNYWGLVNKHQMRGHDALKYGAQPRAEAGSHQGHCGGGTGGCRVSITSTTSRFPHHMHVHSCVNCFIFSHVDNQFPKYLFLTCLSSFINRASQVLSCVPLIDLSPCECLSILIPVVLNKYDLLFDVILPPLFLFCWNVLTILVPLLFHTLELTLQLHTHIEHIQNKNVHWDLDYNYIEFIDQFK